MPIATIYLTDEEDKIITRFSRFWALSKHETIKRIIRRYHIQNSKFNKEAKKKEGEKSG